MPKFKGFIECVKDQYGVVVPASLRRVPSYISGSLVPEPSPWLLLSQFDVYPE